jgi:hypothetical protein
MSGNGKTRNRKVKRKKEKKKNQSIWELRIHFCSNLILFTVSFEKC